MADALGGNSQKVLQDTVKRVNKLLDDVDRAKEKHISPIREDIKRLYAEKKSEGFDVKAIKETVRKSRLGKDLRDQIDVYEHAVFNSLMD